MLSLEAFLRLQTILTRLTMCMDSLGTGANLAFPSVRITTRSFSWQLPSELFKTCLQTLKNSSVGSKKTKCKRNMKITGRCTRMISQTYPYVMSRETLWPQEKWAKSRQFTSGTPTRWKLLALSILEQRLEESLPLVSALAQDTSYVSITQMITTSPFTTLTERSFSSKYQPALMQSLSSSGPRGLMT